jgi:hypothetical protein
MREKNDGGLYFFKIDFSIRTHTGLTDEIDDPLLTFIFGKVQTLRQVTGQLDQIFIEHKRSKNTHPISIL